MSKLEILELVDALPTDKEEKQKIKSNNVFKKALKIYNKESKENQKILLNSYFDYFEKNDDLYGKTISIFELITKSCKDFVTVQG